MKQLYDKEFDCYYDDYYAPPTTPDIGDEFNDSTYYDVQQDKPRRKRKKFTPKALPKMMMFFVAAAAMVGITVYDSFNIDILGQDVIINGLSGGEPVGAYATYLPTGERSPYYTPKGKTYSEAKNNKEHEKELKEWVESVGGDPDSLRYLRNVEFYADVYDSEGETHIWLIGPKEEIEKEAASIHDKENHFRIVWVEYYEADQYNEISGGERADDAFPSLTNLQPNGYVEGFGILNEEFVRFNRRNDPRTYYVVAGAAYGQLPSADVSEGEIDEGYSLLATTDDAEPLSVKYDADDIYWDRNWNQLTLDNFRAEKLNINMMGNSFRIELRGDCRIDHLLVWGFHYGGSVTIITNGGGSLTINEDNLYEYGIFFEAEGSESCLMISPGVNLTVYGSEAAIFIKETTAEKGIYYLSPLTLNGGTRNGISLNDPNQPSLKNYTIYDEDNNYSKYISIK